MRLFPCPPNLIYNIDINQIWLEENAVNIKKKKEKMEGRGKWPLIGAHMPMIDGSYKATMKSVENIGIAAKEGYLLPEKNGFVGTFQCFNGHETSYYRKKLSDKDAKDLVACMTEKGSKVFVHCPFIINLAKDPLEDDKSLKALHGDVTAAGKAGISAVCHIGHGLKNKFTVNNVCRTSVGFGFLGRALNSQISNDPLLTINRGELIVRNKDPLMIRWVRRQLPRPIPEDAH